MLREEGGEGEVEEGRKTGVTYASSSCFIFEYSSFVMDSSPEQRTQCHDNYASREGEEREN